MKTWLKDWKNPALLAAVIIIVFMAIALSARGPVSNTGIVRINAKIITEKMLVDRLKDQNAAGVLRQMISDELLAQYAAKQGVTVTDSDLDQLVDSEAFRLQLTGGKSMDDALSEQGMTMAGYRESLYSTALQAKLLIPDSEVKAEVAKLGHQLDLPARYTIREFVYSNPEDAKAAIESLKRPDGVMDATRAAVNGMAAKRTQMLVEGLHPESDKIIGLVKGLGAGECTQPIATGGVQIVLQLVQSQPAEQGTYDNRAMLVAEQILRAKQTKRTSDFMVKQNDLMAGAMDNADVMFYPAADTYPAVRDSYKKAKNENMVVPGTSDSSTPAKTPAGAATPAGPSAPAAPKAGDQ